MMFYFHVSMIVVYSKRYTYNSRELLSHHDDCTTGGSTANTWDGEKFLKTSEESGSSKDFLLDDELIVCVKEITSSLNFRVS